MKQVTKASRIVFVGGGNMATALLSGLLSAEKAAPGAAQYIWVIEPSKEARAQLALQFGVHTVAGFDADLPALDADDVVVWAVKPQVFGSASRSCGGWGHQALQLSIMAGVTCRTVERLTQAKAVVRAMPNTPALVGQGMTGLFANAGVQTQQQAAVQHLLGATGQLLWVEAEDMLDAVTAVSGSGPAYVFYVMEAMMRAAQELGLSASAAKQLTLQTFAGATHLAQQSVDAPAVLRERVTSKGGTTFAALSHFEQMHVGAHIAQGMHAAAVRAKGLGDELDAEV